MRDFFTFEMGPIGCPETSVRNSYSLRNNPEERSSVSTVSRQTSEELLHIKTQRNIQAFVLKWVVFEFKDYTEKSIA